MTKLREFRVPSDEPTFVGLDDLRQAASLMRTCSALYSVFCVHFGVMAHIGVGRDESFHEWKDRMDSWSKGFNPASLIEAIRSDAVAGRGSCSCIDECYKDAELLKGLCEDGITTRPAAVRWAREIHERFLERERDCQYE